MTFETRHGQYGTEVHSPSGFVADIWESLKGEAYSEFGRYTVSGDFRFEVLGGAVYDSRNYDLQREFEHLFPEVTFDTELSRFYAYCPDAATARRLAETLLTASETFMASL